MIIKEHLEESKRLQSWLKDIEEKHEDEQCKIRDYFSDEAELRWPRETKALDFLNHALDDLDKADFVCSRSCACLDRVRNYTRGLREQIESILSGGE